MPYLYLSLWASLELREHLSRVKLILTKSEYQVAFDLLIFGY